MYHQLPQDTLPNLNIVICTIPTFLYYTHAIHISLIIPFYKALYHLMPSILYIIHEHLLSLTYIPTYLTLPPRALVPLRTCSEKCHIVEKKIFQDTFVNSLIYGYREYEQQKGLRLPNNCTLRLFILLKQPFTIHHHPEGILVQHLGTVEARSQDTDRHQGNQMETQWMEDRKHQGTQERPHEGEAQKVVRIRRQCTRHVRVHVHDARDRDQVRQGKRVQRLGTMVQHQGMTVQRQGTTVEGMNVPILERRLVYIQIVWENLGKGKRMFAVVL